MASGSKHHCMAMLCATSDCNTIQEIELSDSETVYLIHLERPLYRSRRHYLGYTRLDNVEQRLNRHKSGNGAKFLKRANELNISYSIVQTWEFASWKDAKAFERHLKNQKHAPRFCPVCNQSKNENGK